MNDRIGLGWRNELGVEILSNLDKIDFVEVISDDYTDLKKEKVNKLIFIRNHIPMIFHSIQLGIGSTEGIDSKRLKNISKLIDKVKPEYWSEHLSYVRAGKQEVGHMACPSFHPITVESVVSNLSLAKKITGITPRIENIATLIFPPCSELTEKEWLQEILTRVEADFLLDLHNLYANSVNFGFDPIEFIQYIPPSKIKSIHLAGGKWIFQRENKRLLDDHRHLVPDEVWKLLEFTVSYTKNPLDISLEWDSNYPEFKVLLGELEKARHYLKQGRAVQCDKKFIPHSNKTYTTISKKEMIALEVFLTKLFNEKESKEKFQIEPSSVKGYNSLSSNIQKMLNDIDKIGLDFAFYSFDAKRRSKIRV